MLKDATLPEVVDAERPDGSCDSPSCLSAFAIGEHFSQIALLDKSQGMHFSLVNEEVPYLQPQDERHVSGMS